MRAKEFISENKGQKVIYKAKDHTHGKLGVPNDGDPHDVHSRSEGNTEYGSARDKLNPEQFNAMPGPIGVEIDNNPYGMYRLGVSIAAGDRNIPGKDRLGQEGLIMPFSPIEHDYVVQQAKRHGLKVDRLGTPTSDEPGQNNTVSPVAKPKRNKYGI